MDRNSFNKIPILIGKPHNVYVPKEFKIQSTKEIVKDTHIFRIKNNNFLDKVIMPGQFLEVSVLGIGESAISVCNYDDQHIELLIKDVGNVTDHLCNLRSKDTILLRGPYGNGYPMQDIKGKNIVLIAGGTGLAPIRSVIQYILKHRDSYKKVILFVGFNCYDNVLFKDDLEKWKKQITVHMSLDKKSKECSGDVGFVHTMLDKYQIPKDSKFLLCGPPIMIDGVTAKLTQKKYDPTDIFISFERNMRCGVGKCGHCMIHGRYVCTDGPVFTYDISKRFTE